MDHVKKTHGKEDSSEYSAGHSSNFEMDEESSSSTNESVIELAKPKNNLQKGTQKINSTASKFHM